MIANKEYFKFHNKSVIDELLCISLSSDQNDNRKNAFLKLYKSEFNYELIERAKKDEIDSHLANLMEYCGIELTDDLVNVQNHVHDFIETLLGELDSIAKRLHNENISIVALKNAGIARGIYRNKACSPMGDIDLLVKMKDFLKVHNILVNEFQFKFNFRSQLEDETIEAAFKVGGTEYLKIINGFEVWLELQWRPIAGRWIQPSNEPDGDELVERSLKITDSFVKILAPNDNLLQVCLHTAKHSFVRAPGFRLHSDVDRIIRYSDVDWEKFLETVISLKVKTAVYFSLGFANYLLNTPIPQAILEKLRPNFIRGNLIKYYLKKAGLFDKEMKKFSKFGYIIFNMALYDTLKILFNAIFPNPREIKKIYQQKFFITTPLFYLIRLKELVFKREKL